ncbi:MAG: hypothetical protein DRI57_19535 [Deltaproteobacteria bacterium]|nr:MAG: hypothetical protein DRI57_19535 [Deltaproteobacteria bacterium]
MNPYSHRIGKVSNARKIFDLLIFSIQKNAGWLNCYEKSCDRFTPAGIFGNCPVILIKIESKEK